jgi:uncharacterized protein YutE (UPF0331/DUF86 family)
MSNVVINKIETINRCKDRINQEFDDSKEFLSNYTKQDSVILNLERISQAAIDIATHIIRVRNLSLPNSSRELFEILYNNGYITKQTSVSMQKMVGFRNIAVHDYQNLNIEIVINIITNHIGDFDKYVSEITNSFLGE